MEENRNSSRIETILLQKKFRSLYSVVKKIREVEIELDSSEDLTRYISRSSPKTKDVDLLRENSFYQWNYDRKKWKLLSAKERKILFSIFLLSEPDTWRRESLREFLITLNTDSVSREYLGIIELDLIVNEISYFSSSQVRDLSRKIGNIFSFLEKNKIQLSDLFQMKMIRLKKKTPKRLVRHKGYRDHGSLGVEAVGLSSEILDKLIDEEELLLYENNIPTEEELYSSYAFLTDPNFSAF